MTREQLEVLIRPSSVIVAPGTQVVFTADVFNSVDSRVSWRVVEGSAGGIVTLNGSYLAPEESGTYHVVASSLENPEVSATANIEVKTYAATAGTADGLPPTAPVVSLVTPGPVANQNNPTVWGTAEAGTAVSIYANSSCTGESLGLGKASAATGDFGVVVSVADNSTSTFYAKATDIEGLDSQCSATSVTYMEDSISPSVPVVRGTSGVTFPSSDLQVNFVTQSVSFGNAMAPVVTFQEPNAGPALIYTCARDSILDGQVNSETANACDLANMSFDVNTGTLTWSQAKAMGAHEFAIRATWNGANYLTRVFNVFVNNVPRFNNNAPIVSGSADSGTWVKLYDNANCTGAALGQGTANALGTFNIAAAVSDSTTTSFYATSTDAAGNVSLCSLAGKTYIEDSLGEVPTVEFVVPSSPANDNAPVIWGTSEPNAMVRLYGNASCDGAELASGYATSSGYYAIEVLVPNDSSTVFFAKQKDPAGNWSVCSSSYVVYVEDSTPPPEPSLASVTPLSPANNNVPYVFGVAEPFGTIQIFGNSQCSGSSLASGSVTAWGSFSVPVSVEDNSTNNFYAKIIDAAGNASACSSSFVTYVEDSLPPDRPILLSVSPTSPSNSNFPQVLGTAEASSVVKLYANPSCLGGVIGEGSATAQGAFTVTATVAENSSNVVYARAFDAAGNGSPCSISSVVYVEDSIPPAAPAMASTNPLSPSPDNTPYVLGVGEPLATLKLYADPLCQTSVLGTGTVGNDGQFSVEISVANNTSTQIFGQLTDAAGNVSACSTTFVTYDEDSLPPNPPTVLFVDPPPPANNNYPSVSGDSEAWATIKLFTNSSCTGAYIGKGSANEFGAYAVTATVPDNFNGLIYATATDEAGNESICSLNGILYIEDSISPVVTFTSPRNGSTLSASSLGAVSFSGTCSEVGLFVELVASCAYEIVTCSPLGTWQALNVDLSALCPGSVIFTASQKDLAKNEGIAELNLAYFPLWNTDPYDTVAMAQFQSALKAVDSGQNWQAAVIGGNYDGTGKWMGAVVGPQMTSVYGIPHNATTILKVTPGSLTGNVTSTFGSLPVGNQKWEGGVLAPNNVIYGIPRNSSTILKVNPQTDAVSTFGNFVGTDKWSGGVVAPNGIVFGIPFSSGSVLKITPANDTAATLGSLTGEQKWRGGVLAPNGMIYGIPFNSTTVLKIDPATDAISTFGSLVGSQKWAGGVLTPSGAIYAIPYDATSILKIDPLTDTFTTFGSFAGSAKWLGGVIAANGKIYGIPHQATSVLVINPDDDSATTAPLTDISGSWAGASLDAQGHIIAMPYSAGSVLKMLDPLTEGLPGADFILSRHLNKF